MNIHEIENVYLFGLNNSQFGLRIILLRVGKLSVFINESLIASVRFIRWEMLVASE